MTTATPKKSLPKKKSKRKSEASFAISRKAIETLLVNNAETILICTYLTIARPRHKNHVTSSTGLSAITKLLGIGHKKAESALFGLMSMEHNGIKLISQLPDEYTVMRNALEKAHEEFGPRFKEGEYEARLREIENLKTNTPKPTQPRWRLAHPECDVWIPDALVGSKNDNTGFNLKKLTRNSNHVATRMLLLMYQENMLELDAVWPGYVHAENPLEPIQKHGRFSIFHGTINTTFRFDSRFANQCLGDEQGDNSDKLLQAALADLERHGFIYRVMFLMVSDGATSQPKAFYEIDYKDGKVRKGRQKRIDVMMKDAIAQLNCIAPRKDNRSYSDYYLIAPANEKVMFLTAYRLRFSVKNQSNYNVKRSLEMRAHSYQELLHWVEDFLATPAQT